MRLRLRWRFRSAAFRPRSISWNARPRRSKSSAPRSSARPTRTAASAWRKWSGALSEIKEQVTALRARWTQEREAITRISELKKQIEALRFEADEQTRKGQLERAAQIQYGELPEA